MSKSLTLPEPVSSSTKRGTLSHRIVERNKLLDDFIGHGECSINKLFSHNEAWKPGADKVLELQNAHVRIITKSILAGLKSPKPGI